MRWLLINNPAWSCAQTHLIINCYVFLNLTTQSVYQSDCNPTFIYFSKHLHVQQLDSHIVWSASFANCIIFLHLIIKWPPPPPPPSCLPGLLLVVSCMWNIRPRHLQSQTQRHSRAGGIASLFIGQEMKAHGSKGTHLSPIQRAQWVPESMSTSARISPKPFQGRNSMNNSRRSWLLVWSLSLGSRLGWAWKKSGYRQGRILRCSEVLTLSSCLPASGCLLPADVSW